MDAHPTAATVKLTNLRRAVEAACQAFDQAGAPSLAETRADLGTTPIRSIDHPERWTPQQHDLAVSYYAAVVNLLTALDPVVDIIEIGELTALRRKLAPDAPSLPRDITVFRTAMHAADITFQAASAALYETGATNPRRWVPLYDQWISAARAYRAAASNLRAALPAGSGEAIVCQRVEQYLHHQIILAQAQRAV